VRAEYLRSAASQCNGGPIGWWRRVCLVPQEFFAHFNFLILRFKQWTVVPSLMNFRRAMAALIAFARTAHEDEPNPVGRSHRPRGVASQNGPRLFAVVAAP
jgi:hypothetical protein